MAPCLHSLGYAALLCSRRYREPARFTYASCCLPVHRAPSIVRRASLVSTSRQHRAVGEWWGLHDQTEERLVVPIARMSIADMRSHVARPSRCRRAAMARRQRRRFGASRDPGGGVRGRAGDAARAACAFGTAICYNGLALSPGGEGLAASSNQQATASSYHARRITRAPH